MEVYKSKYLIGKHYSNERMLEFIWSSQTDYMEDDEFRHELMMEVEIVKKYKPQSLLLSTTEFQFTIVPDTQSWIDINIYPIWAMEGVKKIALLMAPEIIAQLSIEQAIEENTQDEMQSRFFKSKQEALNWIQINFL